MSKFFNKLDKGSAKFFNKLPEQTKMFGRSARALGRNVGGALGSVGSVVGKAASDLERATAGTALAAPLAPALAGIQLGAGVVKGSGQGLKAISSGKTKEAIIKIEGAVKNVGALKTMTKKK